MADDKVDSSLIDENDVTRKNEVEQNNFRSKHDDKNKPLHASISIEKSSEDEIFTFGESATDNEDDNMGKRNNDTISHLSVKNDQDIIVGEQVLNNKSSDEKEESLLGLGPRARDNEQSVTEERQPIGTTAHHSESYPTTTTQVKTNVERAIRFLKHPSIRNFSMVEKDSYLMSKGLSSQEIEAAKRKLLVEEEKQSSSGQGAKMEQVWDERKGENSNTPSETTDNAHLMNVRPGNWPYSQHGSNYNLDTNSSPPSQNYPYHDPTTYSPNSPYDPSAHTQNPLELPNPLVPMTFGGFVVLFGLASLRWLNGDDFHLFPPLSQTDNAMQIDNQDETVQAENNGQMEVHNDSGIPNTDDNEEGDDDVDEVDDQISYESEDEQDDILFNQSNNNQNFSSVTNALNLQPSSDSSLTQEIKGLTNAIERYTLLQENQLQILSDEKAKNMTDNAMDLLRQQHTEATVDNVDDNDEANLQNKSLHLEMIVQLLETKHVLQSMTDQIMKNIPEKVEDNEKSENDNPETLQVKNLKRILTEVQKLSVSLQSIESNFLPNASVDKGKESNVSNESQKEEDNIELQPSSPVEIPQSPPNDNNDEGDTLKPTNSCPDFMETNEENVSLADRLNYFVKANSADKVKSCAQMMLLYTTNLLSNPTVPRYRKIYTNNSTFKNKVENVDGAKDVLYTVGFEDKGSYLEWQSDADSELLKEASASLDMLQSGKGLSSE